MAGDDFVAVSGGEIAKDFEFTRGEGGECLVGARCGRGNQGLDEACGHFGGEDVVAVDGFADAIEQEVGVDVFQQKAACADAHAFGQVVAVFGNGQHDDGLVRVDAQDLCQCFASVHDGHVKVE